MQHSASRRQFAKALASSPALAALGAAGTGAVAGAADRGSDIKISFPGGRLEDSTLSFMQRIGVEWVNASGPNAPGYSPEGRVISRDGSTDTARGPWNESEIRAMKEKCESFGLHLGILMRTIFGTSSWAGHAGMSKSSTSKNPSESPVAWAYRLSNTTSTR